MRDPESRSMNASGSFDASGGAIGGGQGARDWDFRLSNASLIRTRQRSRLRIAQPVAQSFRSALHAWARSELQERALSCPCHDEGALSGAGCFGFVNHTASNQAIHKNKKYSARKTMRLT